MKSRIHKSDLLCWLAGQREAEKVIRKERVKTLLNLTPDQAWEIYLSLTDNRLGNLHNTNKPSYTLASMRKALERRSNRKRITQ